jgi:hypothetical protein
MKNKLTLRLDESLIKNAKKHAREKGTSVSRLVADYFALIGKQHSSSKDKLPPLTASLSGIMKDTEVKEEDYKYYLTDKHLK